MIGPEDLTNAGEIVEALGQAWTFSHVTPTLRGTFSAWIKGRARQELSEQRRAGILSAEEWRENSSLFNAECAAGAYSWGSPLLADGMGSAVAVALSGPDGKLKLVQLLLEKAHGTVPTAKIMELIQAEPERVAEAVAACLDPNRERPLAGSPLSPQALTSTGETPSSHKTVAMRARA